MTPGPGAPALRFEAGGLRDADGGPAVWPRLGLLGHPVAHSLSPRLHAAALAAAGLPGAYRSIDVNAEDLADALRCASGARVEGLNVTLPHKHAVVELCAHSSEEVRTIGAANTLVGRGQSWHAHNTDARGLAMALERARRRRLSHDLRCVVVLGSGGAARAVVTCVQALGAREVRVVARSPERSRWAVQAGARVFPIAPGSLSGATMVLNTIPLGLAASDPAPVSLQAIADDCFVFDLVYADHETPLLVSARGRGCEASDGLPMLVAQAALAFGMWTGEDPPLSVMASEVGLQW